MFKTLTHDNLGGGGACAFAHFAHF